MMIVYQSRFLNRAEVWYDNEADAQRPVDWILYQQRSQPVTGARTIDYPTYIIDLTRSREELQARLNRDTAYKIRRARERDKITCENRDPRDTAVMDGFEQLYNAFAAVKGRATLNRARMESMAAAGVLDLSVALDPEGKALVYHADYRDDHRATSLELPSLYRKLSSSAERNWISRANRLLTWNNLLRYQEQGLKSFDFGGWYPGNADQERLGINRFKEGFGGKVVREYQCEQLLTLKGRLVLRGAGLLGRAKSSFSRPQKAKTEIPADSVQGDQGEGAVPAD